MAAVQIVELNGQVALANDRFFRARDDINAYERRLALAESSTREQADTVKRVDDATWPLAGTLSTLTSKLNDIEGHQSADFNKAQQAFLQRQNEEMAAEVRAAKDAASDAQRGVAKLSEAEKRRGCAALAYLVHLDEHRVLYPGEARERVLVALAAKLHK